MLMHGCKEGQCSACKSFVLEGEDIEHDRYSTFALPDYEKEEGYTLLCRAHVYEDVTIELLNYDEEMIRSGLPIQQGVAEVVANDPVTHDMRHLVLKLIEPAEIRFFPGQYMDITIPGDGDGAVVLDGQHHQPRRRPARVRHQGVSRTASSRTSWTRRCRSATGWTCPGRSASSPSAKATTTWCSWAVARAWRPILSLLRSMAERGLHRKATFFYGARGQRDLCFESEELRDLEQRLPSFRYVPALSEPSDDDDWDGETGLITDVVKRHAERSVRCSRLCVRAPPMVEAAVPLLAHAGRGGKARLLRQVHHHRRTRAESPPGLTARECPSNDAR